MFFCFCSHAGIIYSKRWRPCDSKFERAYRWRMWRRMCRLHRLLVPRQNYQGKNIIYNILICNTHIILCQVVTQGPNAQKLYFCDIQFDNGEFEEMTPLISRSNRNKRHIRPEPTPESIPTRHDPAPPPATETQESPQAPSQQRSTSTVEDARGRQLLLEALPAGHIARTKSFKTLKKLFKTLCFQDAFQDAFSRR